MFSYIPVVPSKSKNVGYYMICIQIFDHLCDLEQVNISEFHYFFLVFKAEMIRTSKIIV